MTVGAKQWVVVGGDTMTVGAKQWVVVFGNPIDGFGYHGPFDTNEEACEYGDFHDGDNADEYWVALLQYIII